MCRECSRLCSRALVYAGHSPDPLEGMSVPVLTAFGKCLPTNTLLRGREEFVSCNCGLGILYIIAAWIFSKPYQFVHTNKILFLISTSMWLSGLTCPHRGAKQESFGCLTPLLCPQRKVASTLFQASTQALVILHMSLGQCHILVRAWYALWSGRVSWLIPMQAGRVGLVDQCSSRPCSLSPRLLLSSSVLLLCENLHHEPKRGPHHPTSGVLLLRKMWSHTVTSTYLVFHELQNPVSYHCLQFNRWEKLVQKHRVTWGRSNNWYKSETKVERSFSGSKSVSLGP